MNTHGLIALDIDGTITAVRDHLPIDIKLYLEELATSGWQLLFVTGRTFSWSYHLLSGLNVPYLLAVQNGALIVSMPEKRIVYKEYLPASCLTALLQIVVQEKSGMVVYAGFEYQERVLYCPHLFSSEQLEYLAKRAHALHETWEKLDDFSELLLQDFASIRLFEKHEKALLFSGRIEEELLLHAPIMTDSFDPSYRVVQITAGAVSKGFALKEAKKILNIKGTVIACGDDYNDIPMLKEADIRVVMANAPSEVLALADVIAPPAKELGIIVGLKKAQGQG